MLGSAGFRTWRESIASFDPISVASAARPQWRSILPGRWIFWRMISRRIESLGARPIHVVGAKTGATTALRLAARRPDLVATLTVVGLPLKGSKQRPGLDPKLHGVTAWARSSMEERLGVDADPQMLEYWSDLMGRTAESTLLGFSDAAGGFDVRPDLERVACPVLAVSSDSPRHPVAETDAWRRKLRRSELLIVPGEGYHAAAVHPDFCARAKADFIARHAIV
jgi:3-oxoadipate enol-lactonase